MSKKKKQEQAAAPEAELAPDIEPALEASAEDGPALEASAEAEPALRAEGAAVDAAAPSVEDPPEPEPPRDEAAPLVETSEIEDVTARSADEDEDLSPPVDSTARLESIVESLLFASDRPLTIADLKRLLGERDAKKVSAALEALRARHQDTGIPLASLAGGFQFRTHPENGAWVAKLVAGRPQRLSRAMLETLAIVAYRQPITRPEIDEIRGVDCGPVLKTLLDRSLIRMIGKKEDVGRPILYGTTPEFLRTFSLRDLTELPTLREFHELNEAQRAEVDARTEATSGAAAGNGGGTPVTEGAPVPVAPLGPRFDLSTSDPHEHEDEEDALIAELDRAAGAAAKALESPPAQDPQGPPARGPDA
jgi:segregation and condensation protein B